jgi:hypothetical protein
MSSRIWRNHSRAIAITLTVISVLSCATDPTAPGPGVDANGVRYGANVAFVGAKQDSLDLQVWVHNNTAVQKTVDMWICPSFNTKVAVLDAALTTRWTSDAWFFSRGGQYQICVAVGVMLQLKAYETSFPSYARLTFKVADILGDSLPAGDYIIKVDALDQKQIATAKLTFK